MNEQWADVRTPVSDGHLTIQERKNATQIQLTFRMLCYVEMHEKNGMVTKRFLFS